MTRCDICGRDTAHVVIGYGGTSCVPCQIAAGGYVPPDVLEDLEREETDR